MKKRENVFMYLEAGKVKEQLAFFEKITQLKCSEFNKEIFNLNFEEKQYVLYTSKSNTQIFLGNRSELFLHEDTEVKFDGREYYIISLKHSRKFKGAWTMWMPESSGYTLELEEAGLYTATELEKIGVNHIVESDREVELMLQQSTKGVTYLGVIDNIAISCYNLDLIGGPRTRLCMWY